jgi:serine/threonine-protein kinase
MHPESTPTWLVGPEIPPTQRIGTVLSGSYRLDAFLGQGLTGITYNAWHLRQKQPYAVKLLHRELQPSHERVLRLRTDLRVLSGLRRQGFLPVELSFAPDGAPFLASELLIGETLRERLARGPLPSLAAGIVVAAVARALGEAHKQAVVHGDLRPENVLLPSEPGHEVEAGQPVLLDAALHHLRRRPLGLDDSLPLHKLAYLAPEQTSGEQSSADAGGDMFALGAIFYECLTGKAAFSADELEVMYEKLSQPPPQLVLPREVGAPPGLGEALDEVIARACARSPADRYPTMSDFLAALAAAYQRVGLPLPPPDERVAIDTVLSQNRGLRKRTVAVKKIGSAAAPTAEAAAAPTGPAGRAAAAAEVAAPKPAAGDSAKPGSLAESAKAAEPHKNPELHRTQPAFGRALPAPTVSAETPKPAPRQPTPLPALPAAGLPVAPKKPTPAPMAPAPRQPTPLPALPAAGPAPESVKVAAVAPTPARLTPAPVEPAKVAPTSPEPKKPATSSTAKHRAVRHTVKARDLGRLLAEVAAGRLAPEQAMAMAAGQEDLPEPPAPAPAAGSTGESEAQRIIAEGRAAVIARADAARKNRQAEADERMQRAQEQQRKLLEQARQETLARMRAELSESRSAVKPVAKDPDEKPGSEEDLLAEAKQQRERLEAERLEAERQAAQEAQRAHEEATAAELARSEAARAEAALRDAEQLEAARAEAMRVHTEREAEARRLAEQAEAERLRQIDEATAAEHAAAAARSRAAEAAAAAERARHEVEHEAEMAAWEEGLVELVEPSRPPTPPPEALRRKSEKALQAAAEAERAEQQAADALRRALEIRQQAAAMARAAEEAQSAVSAAEQARNREAADLADAVASAEAARARDQELLHMATAAAERAQAAESARQRHAARATRVTQALAVLKQVQDMAQQDPKVPPKSDAAPAPPASSPGIAGAQSAAQSAVTNPGLVEPSGIYAGYSLGDMARQELARDQSGGYRPSQLPIPGSRPEFTGPYGPAQITPAVEQATQSPTRPMPVISTGPAHPEPPSDVIEISAMLPGSAIPIPMSNPGLPHSHGMPMAAGPAGSGALPVMQRQMSPSALHPMMGMPTDTRQIMIPQMVQLPTEPSGVTLTVRQFVVTLTVTSLLSAIIGALIALLVMQRSQPALPPGIERPIIASRTPGTELPQEVQPTPVPQPPAVATQTEVQRPVATPQAPQPDLLPAAVAPVAPPVATPTPPVAPPTPNVPSIPPSHWRPASEKLPPLRLANDLPVFRMHNYAPAAPAARQAGGTTAPATPTPGEAKPTSTPPADTPPATPETKPAETKPATEVKEPAKPKQPATSKPTQGTGDDGLRNPFGP